MPPLVQLFRITTLLNPNFRFAQLLRARQCLIKQAYQSLLSLNLNFRFAQLLCARQCLIKQAYQSLLSLNLNFRFAQLLCARQCLIKQAYQSLLSLNQHFLAIYDVETGLGNLGELAALEVINSFYLFSLNLLNASCALVAEAER